MANDEKLYRDYFNIDPKYYASVTEDLIKKRAVRWDGFYPHDTFVKLLKAVHTMLSGKDSRSLWIEGAYGTGKSHAALAVKSMLEASDYEVRNYFTEFGLANDLCEQILTDKNAGKLITVHRIGSASIRSDQDLILAIQDSITEALRKHDIENKGETSLRDAALLWLESKEANREYFGKLIQESEYAFDFGGASVDSVIDTLKMVNRRSLQSLCEIFSKSQNQMVSLHCALMYRLCVSGLKALLMRIISQVSFSYGTNSLSISSITRTLLLVSRPLRRSASLRLSIS